MPCDRLFIQASACGPKRGLGLSDQTLGGPKPNQSGEFRISVSTENEQFKSANAHVSKRGAASVENEQFNFEIAHFKTVAPQALKTNNLILELFSSSMMLRLFWPTGRIFHTWAFNAQGEPTLADWATIDKCDCISRLGNAQNELVSANWTMHTTRLF